MNRSGSQRGFAAVAAIFIVVVLAALGAFMTVFSGTQQLTAAQDLQGSRAYWAARAGIEYGVAKAFVNADGSCGATLSVDGFSILVACLAQTFSDAGVNNVIVVSVTATATKGGAPGSIGYIERSITATLEK